MSTNVRVRFAPSPTGPLHMGGVRTALFNYLFAKKHGGTFILRIEDTDQNRYVANAEQYIIDALDWCGIPYDEGLGRNETYGPYRQSERKEIYQKYAKALIENDKAYYAFDSAESLDALRKASEAKGETFIYNHTNRATLDNSLHLSPEEVEQNIAQGVPYVLRFKTPTDETLEMKDIIRGVVKIDTNVLDDKILMKADGMPTYHLANIVDDHLMKISHVIRGEEWLPSMALHVLLYQAFGWEVPEFAHLPLILKPTGKGKLSKRDGDQLGFPVFPLNYTNEAGEVSKGYKEEGYFADAFINMLAFLGWNPGTEQEIFSLEELIASFSLEKVSKSGARFSPDKTNWFNQQYLQQKPDEELANLWLPILSEKGIETSIDKVISVVAAIKERAVFVNDFWELGSFYFETPTSYDAKASKKQWKEATPALMQELAETIQNIEDFSSQNVEQEVKAWIQTKEIGMGKVMQPFRLSLVGALKGPHLFDIVAFVGKEETIKRLQLAVENI